MIVFGLPARKEVVFMGNSREILHGFPKASRRALGDELNALQLGFTSRHYRALPSVGAGVYELRHQDERAWYRLAYLVKMKERIYVLHAFEKGSGKTSRKDLRTIGLRLKQAMADIRGEQGR